MISLFNQNSSCFTYTLC